LKKPTISGIIAPTLLFAALTVILNSPVASATSENAIAGKVTKEESIFDRIWGLATLYEGDENALFQKIAFTGRYHGQYHWADGDTGRDDGWENRRFRLGFKGRSLEHFAWKIEIDVAKEDDDDPDESGLSLYNGLTDAYIAWNRFNEFHLTVGKHWIRFTQEGATSSNEILTVERSLLVNQVWPAPELITGIKAEGGLSGGHILYRVAAYAGDKQEEFTRFEAGIGYLTSIGYALGKKIGIHGGVVRADWFHNDGDSGNDAFRDYEDIVSLGLELKQGAFGLTTDLILAKGLEDISDVWGFVILPSYDITKHIQLVTRYHHAEADDANGLTAAKRYEQSAGGGTGDNYDAVYLGLNYYIYGHRLKLMTGAEYSKLEGGTEEGWDGWTVFTGVRVSW
jgi:phosphate-selective porin OprO/OprP